MPGQDLRHAAPVAASWAQLVLEHVEQHGGWTALADALTAHLASVADAPSDSRTVEKGLRRLAARSSGDGGQYGRWLLRFFGLPPRLLRWAAWLGQYHSRFADLPTGLRLEQLL